MDESASRPSFSIIAAAVVLLLVSLAIVCWSAWEAKGIYDQGGSLKQLLLYAQAPTVAILDVLTAAEFVFALLGVFTSIGLLRLRERARTSAIFLSTIPVLALVLALFLFLVAAGEKGRAGLNAGYGVLVCGALLVVLLPLSIWWLIFFTREKVRSQFH